MKSLSILILLGTTGAIVLGAIFAITPTSASSSETVPASIESNAVSDHAVAPVTGEVAAPETVSETTFKEATTSSEVSGNVANTFTADIEKDTTSAKAAQEAMAAEIAAEDLAAEQEQAHFENFVASVSNGKASQVTGIYAEDVLAYSVVRTPSGNAGFVSRDADVVTQFSLAADYGSQAFLAHNYLAGASFFNLSIGQVISVVYGDGSSQQFVIENIKGYQALSPNSTQSNFVDLETGEQLSATSLFYAVYNSGNPVVLQTCIAKDGESSWGRLFIIAVPLS